MTAYQFATIRYRLSPSADEEVNIGLVMWVPSERRLLTRLNRRYGRLSRFFSGFDGDGYRFLMRHLENTFEKITAQLSHGHENLFEEESDTLEKILPQMVPLDSTCIQCSSVMGGVLENPEERFMELYKELVTRHEGRSELERRKEDDIWRSIEGSLRNQGLHLRLDQKVEISSDQYSYEFRRGWQNGVVQVLEPISFDHVDGPYLLEKANTWCGRLLNLQQASTKFQLTAVIALPESPDVQDHFQRAQRMLSGAPNLRKIVEEDAFESFIPEILGDLEVTSEQ